MNTEGLKLVVTTEGQELVVAKGYDKRSLKDVSISGDVGSPAEFYKKRKADVDALVNKTHLLVDVQNGTVILIVDETNPYDNYTIKGQLIPFEEFLKFKINTGHNFGKQEMIDLLKRNKFFFSDPKEHERLVLTFQKFVTRVTKDFQNSDDLKGNVTKLEGYSGVIQGYNNDGTAIEFNPYFFLKIPLFVGQEAETFRVQICLNPCDTKLSFYLEAEDLYEVIMRTKDKSLKTAIEPFEEAFPVIYV